MYWRIPSSHSACRICITFGGTEPGLFLFLQWLLVVQPAVLGDGREPAVIQPWQMGRLSSPSRSPYTKRPRRPGIFSIESIGQGKQQLSCCSALDWYLKQRWASCPSCPWNPPDIPEPERELEWVQSRFQCSCNKGLSLESVWTLCHPEKATQLKLDVGPVHESSLPHDLGSCVKELREH